MKNVAIILIVIISILFSGCDNIPIRSEDEDREEITSEETEASEDPSVSSTSESSGTPAPTTAITTATTETTASVTTAETTPEPTADPNAFIYGGITIIYDFFEGEYTDTDDDTSLASGYLQNLTVEILAYPAAAELINETLEAIRAQSAATYESACLDAQAVYDDYGMAGLAGPYEVNAAVEPAYVSDKLISFFVSVYTYYGGAHGGVIVEAYTFDARSGDYLTFSDLCTDPAAFEHYVQTNVIAFIEAVPPENRMVFDDYATTVVSAFPRAAWVFLDVGGDTRFSITYQQYDIAPYAAGLLSYDIPIADCLPYFNAYGQSLFSE
ncbi:MAG: DUF4163 domain-containing protein [Oscillospiraceae bacterium]|nr:DUF4163 domain-containing protein [Oscillospiraceae bacterium]